MKLQHRALIVGGLAGALIGLATAFLYIRANEAQIAAVEAGEAEAVGKVSLGEALSVGLSIVNLLPQIVGLGRS